jgi:hypothetical protein
MANARFYVRNHFQAPMIDASAWRLEVTGLVHFFDRALVDRLATGFTLLGPTPFEEGALPRRLWRITLRREDAR